MDWNIRKGEKKLLHFANIEIILMALNICTIYCVIIMWKQVEQGQTESHKRATNAPIQRLHILA